VAEGGPQLGLIAGIFGIASEFSNTKDDQPLAGEIKNKADDLAANLAKGYDNATTGLDRLGDILVSDYGKLSVAGPNAIDAWYFNTTKNVSVAQALERSARQLFTRALFPLVYDSYTLQPSRTQHSLAGPYNPNPTDPKTYRCASSGGAGEISNPFDNGATSGWVSVLEGFDKDGKPIRRPHVLSRYVDINQYDVVSDAADAAAPGKLTGPMFSFNNDTGAGLYKESSLARDFTQHDIHC
jgi:hypothetical protein